MARPRNGKLTKKEDTFTKEYIKNGENGTQAALKAYDTKDPKVASAIAVENLSKPIIIEAIEEKKKTIAEQIPDELLVRVHLEGLEATKIIVLGKESITEPDHNTRHKYLESGYKIKNIIKPDAQGNKTLIINITGESAKRYGLIPTHTQSENSST